MWDGIANFSVSVIDVFFNFWIVEFSMYQYTFIIYYG